MLCYCTLLIALVPLSATPVRDRDPDEILVTELHTACWRECLRPESRINLALLDLVRMDGEKREGHCRKYEKIRECVTSCSLPLEDESRERSGYLRPFFRRNYVNELICQRQSSSFEQHSRCVAMSAPGLERCGVTEAVNWEKMERASDDACRMLECALREGPLSARQLCAETEGDAAAAHAGELTRRLVSAFLRERMPLVRVQRACEEL